MIVKVDLTGKVKHVWAGVCKDWGIHYLARTKKEVQEQDGNTPPLPRRSLNWCGPHRVVKLKT